MLYTSEQFATMQLTKRHENVVQGATDRQNQREVLSSFDKHQSREELKRANPQRVKRVDMKKLVRHQGQRNLG